MASQDADQERNPGQRPSGVRARMLPQQRHAHILSALAAQGAVQVSVVAEELGVSDMTVRRDLIDLEAGGKLTRTFGGALDIGAGRQTPVDRDEPHFEARMQRQREAKEAIAATAAALARGYRTIALDVGTTTHLAPELMKSLTKTNIVHVPYKGSGLALIGITTSADANIGNGYTLLSIAGVILGGGEFVGGRVSPIGAVIGALTLALAASPLLTFMHIPPDWQVAANGAILIIVLAARVLISRKER